MPSLFRYKKKVDALRKDATFSKVQPQAQAKAPREAVKVVSQEAPPPAYSSSPIKGDSSVNSPSPALQNDKKVLPSVHVDVDIDAGFSNLTLDSNPKDPDPNTCLAHLKLLFAFQTLKEDVGYTDGQWNIWDSRAELDSQLDSKDIATAWPPGFDSQKATPEDKRKLLLSKIREKRWALYVARAVDRYEAWWASLPQVLLLELDMTEGGPETYHKFVDEKKQWQWEGHNLPPLDVLMV